MQKEEKIFNNFFVEVTGIMDISAYTFSPEIESALVNDMDIQKTIGNINLSAGNISSIPESNKIVTQFLKAKIR